MGQQCVETLNSTEAQDNSKQGAICHFYHLSNSMLGFGPTGNIKALTAVVLRYETGVQY